MHAAIIRAFHDTSQLSRAHIFTDDRLMPITATEGAHTPAPGWVGRSWAQGTLLVGINPGGGGDHQRGNPTDTRLYGLLRDFRDAASDEARAASFEHLSAAWRDIQQGHNIWRIIRPIFTATGESVDQCAFMNILPFRTRMDKPVPAEALRRSWERSALPQIDALRPRRIIALGKKAWDVMSRFALPGNAELLLFKRGIGDSYIPAESQALLESLARRRDANS